MDTYSREQVEDILRCVQRELAEGAYESVLTGNDDNTRYALLASSVAHVAARSVHEWHTRAVRYAAKAGAR